MSDHAPQDRFVDQLAAALDEHEHQRAAAIMAKYRPELEAEFGADATARVVEHSSFLPWALSQMELRDLDEPCQPAWEAVAYLQQHSDAGPDEAFTAVADRARRENER
jgi:hypothetical protein